MVSLAANSFDGYKELNDRAAWSVDKTPHPHQLVVDLGSEQTIAGIRCQPRQDNDHGRIKAYRVFLSATPFPGL